jgi:acyl carrier protein
MDAETLRQTICKLFLGGDLSFPIASNTRLLEEGICDSLGLVQLAAEIERRTPGIKIRDQEITRENFGTPEAILEFLAGKRR